MDTAANVDPFVHYHIYSHDGQGHHVSEMANNLDELKQKFDKAVQTIKDLTGSQVKDKTNYVTIFESGACVKWQPCSDDICRQVYQKEET